MRVISTEDEIIHYHISVGQEEVNCAPFETTGELGGKTGSVGGREGNPNRSEKNAVGYEDLTSIEAGTDCTFLTIGGGKDRAM